MQLVPPNKENYLSSPKMAKIPSEKIQVKVCHTFTFCCNLAEKSKNQVATSKDLSLDLLSAPTRDFPFSGEDDCLLRII